MALQAVTWDMHLHEGTGVSLKSLQATGPKTMDAEAAILWYSLAKLSMPRLTLLIISTLEKLELYFLFKVSNKLTRKVRDSYGYRIGNGRDLGVL